MHHEVGAYDRYRDTVHTDTSPRVVDRWALRSEIIICPPSDIVLRQIAIYVPLLFRSEVAIQNPAANTVRRLPPFNGGNYIRTGVKGIIVWSDDRQ